VLVQTSATPQESRVEVTSVGAASLMVVDDNPKNLKLLDSMLRGSGYQVRLFPRAQLALTAAAKTPPDLFLLDINMPEMDGYTMCGQLKTDPLLREIPVIFLSALNETSDKVKAFEVGGVDYITKPFQIEEVRVRINTHLEIRRQRLLLQESYQKLQELESLRDSLVHMIVHDMRTPLTIIQNGLELVNRSDGAHLSEKGTRWLTNVQHRTAELIEMVNSLLDISKFESGRMDLDRTEFNLAELVKKIETGFSTVQTHRITAQVDENPLWATADLPLVTRVVQNLLGNAIKYSPQGTEIKVTVSTSSDGLAVSVIDQGPGIPEEHRGRVFDKFFQIGHAKNSSGLGLAFCKMVVDAHGGTIGVDPAPNGGSCFWFQLPNQSRQPVDNRASE
jgi:two-component system, sensor histidine kinase and response regulator